MTSTRITNPDNDHCNGHHTQWSASQQRHVPIPHGIDPDEFRSRKTAGELRDIAHGRRGIREFIARVLIRKIDMGNR